MPPERRRAEPPSSRGGTTALLLAAVALAATAFPAPRACAEDLPAEYASRTNPFVGAAAAERGRELFSGNCAPCHGEAADGHGPASVGLTPPPANLAGPDVVPAHSDAYLFYRMTVGKRGSAMPSFLHSLSENERWELVVYLRSLAQRRRGVTVEPAAPGGSG